MREFQTRSAPIHSSPHRAWPICWIVRIANFPPANQGIFLIFEKMSRSRRIFGDSRRGFGASRRGVGTSRRGFGDSRSSFGTFRRGFETFRRGFGDSKLRFGTSRRGFGDSRRGFGTSRRGYAVTVDCKVVDPPGNPGNEGWCHHDPPDRPEAAGGGRREHRPGRRCPAPRPGQEG